jgi:hypothetical protein
MRHIDKPILLPIIFALLMILVYAAPVKRMALPPAAESVSPEPVAASASEIIWTPKRGPLKEFTVKLTEERR